MDELPKASHRNKRQKALGYILSASVQLSTAARILGTGELDHHLVSLSQYIQELSKELEDVHQT